VLVFCAVGVWFVGSLPQLHHVRETDVFPTCYDLKKIQLWGR
jgi:hypothetical protein